MDFGEVSLGPSAYHFRSSGALGDYNLCLLLIAGRVLDFSFCVVDFT